MILELVDCLADVVLKTDLTKAEAEQILATTKGNEYGYHIIPKSVQKLPTPRQIDPMPQKPVFTGELF